MKTILILIIRTYKRFISPIFFSLLGSGCRFSPTCSEYATDAIEKYGAIKGGALAFKRISRCHPNSRVYHDPVPGLKQQQ